MQFCLHPLIPHWIQGLDLGSAPSVKAIWIIFPWLLLIPPFIRLFPCLPLFVVSCWAELHVSVPIPRSWCHTGQAMSSPREGLSGFSMQRAHGIQVPQEPPKASFSWSEVRIWWPCVLKSSVLQVWWPFCTLWNPSAVLSLMPQPVRGECTPASNSAAFICITVAWGCLAGNQTPLQMALRRQPSVSLSHWVSLF